MIGFFARLLGLPGPGILVGAAAILTTIGLYGWHLYARIDDQAAVIAQQQQALAGAVATNQQNLAALARYKEETEKAEAALAASEQHATDRVEAVASIHQEIAHVTPKPGPALGLGPYAATALARLRILRQGTADGDHQAPDRAHPDPAAAAALPARPGHP